MSRIRHEIKVKYDENNKPVDILVADNKPLNVVRSEVNPVTGRIRNSLGCIAPVRRDTVVLLGDSITDMCGGTKLDGSYVPTFSYSYWTWANAALGWRFSSVINAGVSGDTIEGMAARFDAQVAPHNPAVIVLEALTNNAFQATAINAESVYSSAKEKWYEILRKAQNINALVAATTIPPFGSAAAPTAAQIAMRARLNRMVRKAAQFEDNVVLADWDAALLDQTTAYRPIGEIDGKQPVYNDNIVHQNGAGGVIEGKCLANALRPFVGANIARIPRGIPPAQIVTNPNLIGASGATAPTNWTAASLSSPATSWAFSYENRSDDVNSQQLVAQFSASGISPRAQLQHFANITTTDYPVGTKLRCALEIDAEYVSSDENAQIGLYFAVTTNGAAPIADTGIMHDASINSGGQTRIVNSSAVLPQQMAFITEPVVVTATTGGILIKIRLGGTYKFKVKNCVVFADE